MDTNPSRPMLNWRRQSSEQRTSAYHAVTHTAPKTRGAVRSARRYTQEEQWHTTTMRNDPAVQQSWEHYKVASRKVKLERAKLIVRQKRNWQRKVLQEGDSGSKTLWKPLDVPPTSLQAVKSGNTVVTDPAQITKHIFEHFHSLANQPTSDTAVTFPANTMQTQPWTH